MNARSRFLILLAILGYPGLGAAESRPNVLFLVADDLNCDLGCYGHEDVRSPHIDALAARGVRFEHAYCQYPLCCPSRTSFLTGRRPNATGILTNSGPGGEFGSTPHFRENIPDAVTLPQLFRQNDYRVARIGKLYHYGVPTQIGTEGSDDRASWDFVINPAGRDKAEEKEIFSLVPGSFGGTLSWMASDGTDTEQTDGLIATAAVSVLERLREKPFFLAVGFFRPHTPYVAPRSYFDLYPPDEIQLPELSADDKARQPAPAYASAKPEQATMNDRLRREAIQAYHASISFMDAQVGRVVAALDDLGLAKNTIIVMTSDHGYHMYDHGLWQKQSIWENSARVPLIIVAPGAAGNGQAAVTMSELVDLYPTLADLCGLTLPEGPDGVSLRPALEDPQRSVKEGAFTQVRRQDVSGYSVRTDRWRFISWGGGSAGEQLYDMQADPRETTNLAGKPEHLETVKKLRGLVGPYSQNEPTERPRRRNQNRRNGR